MVDEKNPFVNELKVFLFYTKNKLYLKLQYLLTILLILN